MAKLIDIVSTRAKAQVFRILFGITKPELHLREIVRQSGLSVGTVQQELQNLCKVGLVSKRRDGNRLYFAANKQHPLYADLSSLVAKTDGLVEVLRPAVEIDTVKVAFVFGSIARDETQAGSDVDLMVIGSISLRSLIGRLSGLGTILGREINPHVLTPAEFRQRKASGDHFLKSVLAQKRLFIKGTERELATMGKQPLVEATQDKPARNRSPIRHR